jgi:hypothetical protein
MSDRIISVYKHADNVLGYEKQYIAPEELATCDKGWFRTQAEAINDVPVVKPKRKAGRPRKAK